MHEVDIGKSLCFLKEMSANRCRIFTGAPAGQNGKSIVETSPSQSPTGVPFPCNAQGRRIPWKFDRNLSRFRESETMSHRGTCQQRWRKVASVRVSLVGKGRVAWKLRPWLGLICIRLSGLSSSWLRCLSGPHSGRSRCYSLRCKSSSR